MTVDGTHELVSLHAENLTGPITGPWRVHTTTMVLEGIDSWSRRRTTWSPTTSGERQMCSRTGARRARSELAFWRRCISWMQAKDGRSRPRGGRPRADPIGLLPPRVVLMTAANEMRLSNASRCSWTPGCNQREHMPRRRRTVCEHQRPSRAESCFPAPRASSLIRKPRESRACFSTTVNNMCVFPLVRGLVPSAVWKLPHLLACDMSEVVSAGPPLV